MERKEIERRVSRRNTSTGTSIWSRKSVKRSAQPSSQPRQPQASSRSPVAEKDILRRNEDEREMEILEQREQPDSLPALASTRSIIPDPLKDLPAWYLKDDLASNSVALYKMRFNIHNPVGPRRYYNHHLIPPSQKSASRPPSIFSPSFPAHGHLFRAGAVGRIHANAWPQPYALKLAPSDAQFVTGSRRRHRWQA